MRSAVGQTEFFSSFEASPLAQEAAGAEKQRMMEASSERAQIKYAMRSTQYLLTKRKSDG